MTPGHVTVTPLLAGDAGWLSVRAERHVLAADVLVLDREVPLWSLGDTGAARVPVDGAADGAEAVLHEALAGQAVVRIVLPEHWETALTDEIPVWQANGIPVLALPGVTSDQLLAVRHAQDAHHPGLALGGCRVLVLRPAGRQDALRDLLEERGATVLSAPILRIEPPGWEAADAILLRLHRYRWAVFTSVNGVDTLLDRLRFVGDDVRSLPLRIAAVGHATRDRLRDYCLRVDLVPSGSENQEGLLQEFRDHGVRGESILVVVGERHSPLLAQGLRESGAMVDEVVMYRTTPEPLAPWAREAVTRGEVDAVLLTSPSSLDFLAAELDGPARARLAAMIRVSMGPTTTRHCAAMGYPATIEAASPSTESLVQALQVAYARRQDDEEGVAHGH